MTRKSSKSDGTVLHPAAASPGDVFNPRLKYGLGRLLHDLPQGVQDWISDFLGRLHEKKKIPQAFIRELVLSYLRALGGNELGVIFGESKSNIDAWFNRGCPRNQDSTYSFTPFVQWYKNYQKRDAQTLTTSRSRKTNAEASLAELELAEETGRLVDREIQDRAWGEHVTTAKGMLLGLPHRLALILPEKDRLRFIAEAQTEIEGVLKNLAKGGDEAHPKP